MGLGNIAITWVADVIFPSNYVSGVLCDAAITTPAWAKSLQPISSPGYTNVVWLNTKGSHHEWKVTEVFRADSLKIDWSIDGNIIYSQTYLNGGYLSIVGNQYNSSAPKYYRIYASFESKEDPLSSYKLEIETTPFFLVKAGNDFYFVDKIPSSSSGPDIS